MRPREAVTVVPVTSAELMTTAIRQRRACDAAPAPTQPPPLTSAREPARQARTLRRALSMLPAVFPASPATWTTVGTWDRDAEPLPYHQILGVAESVPDAGTKTSASFSGGQNRTHAKEKISGVVGLEAGSGEDSSKRGHEEECTTAALQRTAAAHATAAEIERMKAALEEKDALHASTVRKLGNEIEGLRTQPSDPNPNLHPNPRLESGA